MDGNALPDTPAQPPGMDTPPGPPETAAATLTGRYGSQSIWDVSSALPTSLGDLVADLVVDAITAELVNRPEIPDATADEIRQATAGAIHEPVRDFVDANAPAALGPQSELIAALHEIVSDVEVSSVLDLSQAGNELVGLEQLTAVTLSYGGTTLRVTESELAAASDLVRVAADIEGTVTSPSALALATHELAVRFDVLATRAASELIGLLGAEDLAAQAAGAVACTAVVDRVTGGGDSLDLSVAGRSIAVGVEILLEGCERARGEIRDYGLGLVRRNAGVALGGALLMADSDGNRAIDTLVSEEDYYGELTAYPTAQKPRFPVYLAAERLP